MDGWQTYPLATSNGEAKPAETPARKAKAEKATPALANPMARIRLNTVSDVAKELRKLYREARAGSLATNEASKLAFLLTTLANIMATSDLEERLAILEAAKAGR